MVVPSGGLRSPNSFYDSGDKTCSLLSLQGRQARTTGLEPRGKPLQGRSGVTGRSAVDRQSDLIPSVLKRGSGATVSGWDSEQSVEFDAALSVHRSHSVLVLSGRARLMSDLTMLQRVAERAVPPASRAEGPKKWDFLGLLGRISSICALV